MPHKDFLSLAQRVQLLTLPSDLQTIGELYTLTHADHEFIADRRTGGNRLGMAVQLCFLRFPGRAWTPGEILPASMLRFIAQQIGGRPSDLAMYARRDETRREHLSELLKEYGWRMFSVQDYREFSEWLTDQARSTDQGFILVNLLINEIRRRHAVVPALSVLMRLTLASRAQARREAYSGLTKDLTFQQKQKLDALLGRRQGSRHTYLGWLRQPSAVASPGNILGFIERLRFIRELEIPLEWAQRLHQNRLTQIAREGSNTDVTHFREMEDERRYATLVATVLDTAIFLTDEILDMHGSFMGRQFKQAERKHLNAFQENGKSINDKLRLYAAIGRALIDAREQSEDPFIAVEKLLTWDAFRESVEEADRLAQPAEFDHLPLVAEGYSQLRRYAPALLETFEFRATPASEDILQAIKLLKRLNAKNVRRIPDDAPTGFIRQRWAKVVFTTKGIDRRFYETCVLSELSKALRAGDLWVTGSRRYKDFEEYLLPRTAFKKLQDKDGLDLAVDSDGPAYLSQRSQQLHSEMLTTAGMARAGALQDASIADGVLKVAPLASQEPDEALLLGRQVYAMLPHIKITDLLVEDDEWTGFTRHFTHLRGGGPAKDRELLLAAILADGINLGIARMAEACPGVSSSTLGRVAAWHIREETYAKALAEIVNHHHKLEFSGHWGDGTTSSSDGQRFPTGGRGDAHGQYNARYGSDPGVTFYTHISDQYAPFHTKLINATVRDATHVLDGLLYHESDLRIEEHYTDTAGFTDHVFALCHLLGFRFAPRIRNLGETRLFSIEKPGSYPEMGKLIAGTLNTKQIARNWDDILRLATSIKRGSVSASLMLRKLGSYPRQNSLAGALREVGKLERTLFLLQYIRDVDLRRRIHAGLNKGEARNALARAVFFNRLGELRDRTHENQQHRASGLNLVVAAIILWNSVYLEQTVSALRWGGQDIPDELLAHLSPLKWEHINLTGDYHWRRDAGLRNRRLRPLRSPEKALKLAA
jgi:TnpA family transposase